MRSFAILCAASLLAVSAAAQMNTGAAPDPSVTVIDVNRSQNQIVVQDAAGRQRTLLLNDQTRFERQGAPGTAATAMRLDDVVVGDRLLAGPTQRGFTRRIQVLPPGAARAPQAPGTVRPGADPADPPAGVNTPGVSNPAAPGASRPGAVQPADPPTGVNRPGVANPAAPQPAAPRPAAPAPGGASGGSGGAGGSGGGSGGGGGM